MKEVIATKTGYHDCLREPGDRFMVDDDMTASWFKDADKAKPAKPSDDADKAKPAKPSDDADKAKPAKS